MAKRNKVKKPGLLLSGKFDYSIFFITLALLSIGLMMLLSASAPKAFSEFGNIYEYVLKQGVLAVVGIVLMLVLAKIDYRIFKKFDWIIYIAVTIVLVLVGFFGVGENGARRWINLFGFTFQPSEVAKVGYVIFFASLLTDLKEKNKIQRFWMGFVLPLVLLLPMVYAIYKLQNHLSATIIIAAVTIIQMFIAGTAFKYLGTTIITGVIAVLTYIIAGLSSPNPDNFRLGRIITWLNIESDLTGTGWQINQSLYAIGSGGLFGLGLGQSKQKYLYLPEAHNDFVFAILSEELGFIGGFAVIVLFALFVWRGIVIATKAEDTFGMLVAIGITSIIGLQALINIAVVTNTIPVTGMPLPFFSYGGTAMLVDVAAVGILLSVSRNCKKSTNEKSNRKL